MEIGAYFTIITAIIAAFLTYRNQLRLKAFELFLTRRDSVLKDIENFIDKLYIIQNELDSSAEAVTFNRYKKEFFHEGLIIYHKAKGANFGGVSSAMLETFWSIINEPVRNDSKLDSKDWVHRTLNSLTALYGFAHSQVTKEIESMAFTFFGKIKRKYSSRTKFEKKLKQFRPFNFFRFFPRSTGRAKEKRKAESINN
jgi:hypothetical protein